MLARVSREPCPPATTSRVRLRRGRRPPSRRPGSSPGLLEERIAEEQVEAAATRPREGMSRQEPRRKIGRRAMSPRPRDAGGAGCLLFRVVPRRPASPSSIQTSGRKAAGATKHVRHPLPCGRGQGEGRTVPNETRGNRRARWSRACPSPRSLPRVALSHTGEGVDLDPAGGSPHDTGNSAVRPAETLKATRWTSSPR
jgi:hypothetical protein